MKDLKSLDAAFVVGTFLLLLIGTGIALVPFPDATVGMPKAPSTGCYEDADHRRRAGGLLTRLPRFSPVRWASWAASSC